MSQDLSGPTKNPLPPDRRAKQDAGPDLHGGVDVEEYVAIAPDPDEIQITEAADGSGDAFVDLPGERQESTPHDAEFYDNLAEIIPDVVRSRIVVDLLRRIEDDKSARELRDKQYAEGLRRTGMGNDAPGGAQFEGASKVVHPMMAEACVDYNARIMKEIMPPSGPVKPKIVGIVTQEKADKARRKTEHMNYQITVQMKEARSVFETTFTQVPLGGSQFVHLWWDHKLKRPRIEFRAVDKWYIPFSAADFASASRKTYADTITEVEFRKRVDGGQYRQIDLPPPSQHPDPSKTEKANQKIEGLDDPGMNLDGDREIYETLTYLEVTEDMADVLDKESAGEIYPYIVTMDVATKEMVAMYRCWEDGDDAREPIEHDFEFPFLPWRGALSIGFPQLIGGLSAAATGALRALMDSAHINNVASGLIKKGASASGQSRSPAIGELMEIDIGLEASDIRQAVMPFPFNPPSPVLFQLLGFVVDAAKGIVRTTLDETPQNSGAPVPVGTQMSRVEEGLVVFSAIHGRAHAAFNRMLMGLHRLNKLYLPAELKVDAAGKELMVSRSDYEGPCDVQPVSDPTVYSDQQRFNQIAYIQDRMMKNPGLYKAREVELASLKLIKWPDPETLLVDAPQPHELNQVNENLAMALGQPVSVFPQQDHLAHLQVLLDFMKSPVLGSNPLLAPAFLPAALKHATQHMAYLYVSSTVDTITKAAGVDAAQLMGDDERVKRKMDELLAVASRKVVPSLEATLQHVVPILQQAAQLLRSMQPPPPMDPAAAAVQAAAAETQRKGVADQASNQIDQQKLALQQQENAIQSDRVDAMRENTATQAQTKETTTAADNQTALDIASSRIASGQGAGFRNGESMTGG